MPDQTIAERAEQFREAGKEAVAGGLEAVAESDVSKFVAALVADVLGLVLKTSFTVLGPIGEGCMRGIAEAEDQLAPMLSRYAALAVNDIFGTNVSPGDFAKFGGGTGRTVAGPALGRAMLAQLQGSTSGTLEPSDAAATKYIGAMAGIAIEDWFKGWFFEVISSLVPLDVGKIEKYGDLSDKVGRVLGLDGVSRRVLRPLVDTTIVTPLEWKTKRTYRPTLLSASLAARLIARAPDQAERWREELRRQGYSDDRIDILVEEQRKAFSASDVRTFVSREHWTHQQGLQHLIAQGYDQEAAENALRLEGLRRFEQLEAAEASAIIGAYVAGDIDRGALVSMLSAAVRPAAERALLEELADVRRAVNVKHLSLSQVESMVKSGVLSVVDYRRAAEREGYADDAVAALELQLRWELDRARDVAELRAEQAAQRAAEKAKREEAAAARRVQLEEKRKLERRGKEADLERAAIRGLIPLERVAEIYAAEFDDETAGIYMEILEADRQAYLDQQKARDEAAKRAGVRGIDVGALEQAVLRRVLNIAEYRGELARRGFPAGDVAILVGTLQAKLDDLAAAQAAREQAAKDAAVKHVSLSTIEMLVRRGHRSMADYDRTIADLGYDEGARAAMRELLQDRIDEDAAARAARDANANKRDARGLSLEQMRRAVLLGTATDDQFQTYLVAENYTPEAQRVLLAQLRADVTEAEAARQRRAEADAAKHTRDAPISDVARAARLGLIPVSVYVDRLARDGFTDDAIALEVDLLVEEMAAAADAREQREAAELASRDRPLSLADTARSVRAGILTIDSYTAAARSAGYSEEAAATLGRLLGEELAAAAAAKVRRDQVAAAARVRRLSLGQLEAAVKLGERSLDDYAAAILELGYQDDDVALLVALLAAQLGIVDDAERRRAQIAAAEPERSADLSRVETAVLEGLLSMDGYLNELRSRGFGAGDGLVFDIDGRLVLAEGIEQPPDDTALLALLLQVRLDAKGAKGTA